MMIYISYFGRINAIKAADKNAVFCAVCGGVPDWYNGNWCKKVAPRWVWWKEWHDKYAGKYESEESKTFYIEKYNNTVLDKLCRNDIVDELKTIANGKNLYLLCFETPEKFCHRHLLADWLNEILDVKIVEWNP